MTPTDLPRRATAPAKVDPALRICKRCGARGLVSAQGIVHLMEVS